MDMKLELAMVPVTDVDRAKEFYAGAGFVRDHDQTVSDEIRLVQLTPPGSACSIAIGRGLTRLEPGSMDNLQMVVADPDGNRWALQELPDYSATPQRLLRLKSVAGPRIMD